MVTVAQCLWVKHDPNNYYPFVADQICNLARHRSIILTHGESHHSGYPGLPIYAPYSRDNYRPFRVFNRVTERAFGTPWLLATAVRKHKVGLLIGLARLEDEAHKFDNGSYRSQGQGI